MYNVSSMLFAGSCHVTCNHDKFCEICIQLSKTVLVYVTYVFRSYTHTVNLCIILVCLTINKSESITPPPPPPPPHTHTHTADTYLKTHRFGGGGRLLRNTVKTDVHGE